MENKTVRYIRNKHRLFNEMKRSSMRESLKNDINNQPNKDNNNDNDYLFCDESVPSVSSR